MLNGLNGAVGTSGAINNNVSTSGYGTIIGSAVGAVAGIMKQKAQNDALEEKAKYNNKMLELNDNLAKFQQSMNLNRANETINAYFEDIKKSQIELKTQKEQEISKIENVQLSGITAGNTKARQIQTAYREVGKQLGAIEQKGENIVNQVLEKARADNEALQIQKINNYNQTVASNAQLAGQAITGMNAALLVANSSAKYAQTGYNLGEKFDTANLLKVQNQTPTERLFNN